MTKLKIFISIVAAAIILFVTCIGCIPAKADTANEYTIENVAETESNIEDLAAQFTEYLRAKYGDEFEIYYSSIIAKWGSIEGYLLAFGDNMPEQHKTGWDKFVAWLSKYAPVWAVPLAVSIIIVIAVVGKKQFYKIIEKTVNSKLRPIVKELNAQSSATVQIMDAQKALLGNNEKFAENVKALSQAKERLVDNE